MHEKEKGTEMTIGNVSNQTNDQGEKPALTVQLEIQKDVLKDTMGASGTQKQLLQLMNQSNQLTPNQSTQQVARNQISKGYLDIKI